MGEGVRSLSTSFVRTDLQRVAVRGLYLSVVCLSIITLVVGVTNADRASISLMCRGDVFVSMSRGRTKLGGSVVSWFVAIFGVIVAGIKREFSWVLAFLLVPFLAARVGAIIKDAIMRPRPPIACAGISLSGFSFPSAHATSVTAGFILLALFFAAMVGLRWWLSALAWVLAGSVSVSRCVLGAHYPSDVLGGMILGGTLAYMVPLTMRGRSDRQHSFERGSNVTL